jgi:hypothetical protein
VDEEEQILWGGGEVGVRVEDAKLRAARADRGEAAAAAHEGGVAGEGVDVQAAEERALLLGHGGHERRRREEESPSFKTLFLWGILINRKCRKFKFIKIQRRLS